MKSMTYNKVLPALTADSQPYWEGCQRSELLIQHCARCQRPRFYPRWLCPWCGHDQSEWKAASGRGVVHAVSIVYRAPSPAFAADAPYVIALVELPEGIRLMSNVVECDPKAVTIGMPVEVVFDAVTDEVTLPKFRPAPGSLDEREFTAARRGDKRE